MLDFLKNNVELSKKEIDELNLSVYRKMMDFVYESPKSNKHLKASFRDMIRSTINIDLSKGYSYGFFMTINNGEEKTDYGFEEIEFTFNSSFEVVAAELHSLSM